MFLAVCNILCIAIKKIGKILQDLIQKSSPITHQKTVQGYQRPECEKINVM